MEGIRRARMHIAASFVASASLVLLLLAGILFGLLVRERSLELTHDLEGATLETIKAAAVVANSEASPERAALEAVDELSTRDIPLYLFDRTLRNLGSIVAPTEVVAAARDAARLGVSRSKFNRHSQRWRLVGQAFTVRATPFVVVAVADESDLNARYVRLLYLFSIAAGLGVLLLGITSYLYAGRAIKPIQSNMQATRRFMSDAAHELRTPIAAVRAHSEVALGYPDLAPGAVASLRIIQAESSRLSELVGDLLLLARAEVGERRVIRKPLFLDDLVSDVIAAAAPLARAKQITLRQDRYEQARVNGDAQLVRQLLAILLDNAVKYTPAGGAITMDVFVDNGAAVLVVSDTGIGIEPDALARIYDRFHRGERAREMAPGAGLGLSIAQWIAQVHNAALRVTSSPERGTRFEIRFPEST